MTRSENFEQEKPVYHEKNKKIKHYHFEEKNIWIDSNLIHNMV